MSNNELIQLSLVLVHPAHEQYFEVHTCIQCMSNTLLGCVVCGMGGFDWSWADEGSKQKAIPLCPFMSCGLTGLESLQTQGSLDTPAVHPVSHTL